MRRHKFNRGFTIIEAAISVVIVGVMFASALSMTGTSKLTRYRRALTDRATVLADSLLTEIMSLPYEDPDDVTTAMGSETRDTSVYNALVGADPNHYTIRRDWCDDVDDLHGWLEKPPIAYDGSPIESLVGWQRRVKVQWINPSNLSEPSATETGLKEIIVTVTYENQITISVSGIRSSGR